MSKEYVNRLSYLDYSTIYSCEGTVSNYLSSRACFGSVLNAGTNIHKEIYKIYLIIDPEYALNKHKANLCFLSKKEVKKHLLYVRRLFPFTYTVEESRYDGFAAFLVTIDLEGNHFYHRYLLTWFRYLYEFPYNLILNDALRMKHEYLRKVSLPNLFILCANSYCYGPTSYGAGHAIAYNNSAFLKEKDLKQKINEMAEKNDRWSYINNIYPKLNCSITRLPRHDYDHYLEYWTNSEDFENRAKIYLENYQRIKEQ